MNATGVCTWINSVRVWPFHITRNFPQLVFIKIFQHIYGFTSCYIVFTKWFCHVGYIIVQFSIVVLVEDEQTLLREILQYKTSDTYTMVLKRWEILWSTNLRKFNIIFSLNLNIQIVLKFQVNKTDRWTIFKIIKAQNRQKLRTK